MNKDEKAAEKAAIKYSKAIDKYFLDDVEDGWGQSRKRYMLDAFYAGFYAGRNYQKRKENKNGSQRKSL